MDMAKKKKQVTRRHDKLLQVWVDQDLWDFFREAAEADGRVLSNWVRDRLQKAAKRELKK